MLTKDYHFPLKMNLDKGKKSGGAEFQIGFFRRALRSVCSPRIIFLLKMNLDKAKQTAWTMGNDYFSGKKTGEPSFKLDF